MIIKVTISRIWILRFTNCQPELNCILGAAVQRLARALFTTATIKTLKRERGTPCHSRQNGQRLGYQHNISAGHKIKSTLLTPATIKKAEHSLLNNATVKAKNGMRSTSSWKIQLHQNVKLGEHHLLPQQSRLKTDSLSRCTFP